MWKPPLRGVRRLIRTITGHRNASIRLHQAETDLRLVMECLSNTDRDDPFRPLAHFAISVVKADAVLFGELVRSDTVRGVIHSAPANTARTMEYRIAGTPCERVISSREIYSCASVRNLFPSDYLAELNADSYIGVPLMDSSRRVLGVVALIRSSPFSDPEKAATVARLLGIRVAAELERRSMERQISKLSRMAEKSPASVIVTDWTGTIEFVNLKFIESTGYTAEEAVGKNPRILKSDDANPEKFAMLWRTITTGQEWRGEFRNKRKDGTTFYELASISPIADAAGTITHFVSIAEDITQRRQLEEQLQQSQRMSQLGQLTAGVVHDVSNLLTIITAYGEMLSASLGSNDRFRDDLEEIRHAADRAGALTRQLLSFSRMQTRTWENLDPNRVIANIARMLRRLIQENIEVAVELDAEAGKLRGDPGQLEQVIVNLAVNARDVMKGGGRLTISTQAVELQVEEARELGVPPGFYVRIDVAATGGGIDPNIVSRIFEPFFTTKKEGTGTGLGLSIVNAIVKRSHGAVAVRSVVGAGTTFSMYFPRQGESSGLAEPVRKVLPAAEGYETVLLIEDDPGVRGLVKTLLERLGYNVLEAGSGEDALRLLRDHQLALQLMITDMLLPGMSGKEAAKRVAQLRPGTPILYISGRFLLDEAPERELNEGRVGILAKPFTPNALDLAVRQLLQPEPSGDSACR